MALLTLTFSVQQGRPILEEASYQQTDMALPETVDFQWDKGPQALCVFFLRARYWRLKGGDPKKRSFVLSGKSKPSPSPAKTLFEELRKEKSGEAGDRHPMWVYEFLGEEDKRPRLKDIIRVAIPHQTPQAEFIENSSVLTTDTLTIICEETDVSHFPAALQWLSETLDLHYFSSKAHDLDSTLISQWEDLLGELADHKKRVTEPVIHNLESSDNVFVGRERELTMIGEWLKQRRYRAIAITGIGGVGKSSLAERAAWRNLNSFSAVVYCSAKHHVRSRTLTMDDVYDVIDSVLQLGGQISRLPSCHESSDRVERTAAVINSAAHLLVLDNLEVLHEDDLGALTQLLRRIDSRVGTMVVLTHRPEQLPPLVNPIEESLYVLRLESLDQASAIDLLCQLLEGQSTFDKISHVSTKMAEREMRALACSSNATEDYFAGLGRLAEAAHRHPLMLRYAAALLCDAKNDWNTTLSYLDQLRGPLQDRAEDLIGTMCDHLSSDGLSVIQLLGLFAGGAKREAIRFVWATPQKSASFDRALDEAARASLIETSTGRFGLHPLVQQFVDRRRPASEDHRELWQRRHAEYYCDLAERATKLHDLLGKEWLNLTAAMEWAGKSNEDMMTIRLALCLFDFMRVRGLWGDAKRQLQRAIAATERAKNHAIKAQLHHRLAELSRYSGDHASAKRQNVIALGLVGANPDDQLESHILRELAILDRHKGEYSEAESKLRQSIEMARDDAVTLSWTPHELGVLLSFMDRDEEAQPLFQQSVRLAELLADRALKANSLLHLAILMLKQNSYENAEITCFEARSCAEDIDDKVTLARILSEYGEIIGFRNRAVEARQYFEESLRIKSILGDITGQIVTHCHVAELERRQGNLEVAEEAHEKSSKLGTQYNNPYWRARNSYGMSLCARRRALQSDESKQRKKHLEQARRLAKDAKNYVSGIVSPKLDADIRGLVAQLESMT